MEIASGVSGLVSAVVLGHRKGYGKEVFEPHNILLTTVGAGMLWAGWFGFNGGSAFTSGIVMNYYCLSLCSLDQLIAFHILIGTRASYAVLMSQISAGVAALSWTIIEFIHIGQPKV